MKNVTVVKAGKIVSKRGTNHAWAKSGHGRTVALHYLRPGQSKTDYECRLAAERVNA